MSPSPIGPAPSSRTRRWRVPPPLTRGPDLLEGADILREMSGESAVLVWKSLRNVTLWATATSREHAGLFAEGAEERRVAEILVADVEADLLGPLHTFAAVLGGPGQVRRETVALACRQVAQWAQANDYAATALAFTQAAALVCPGDAQLAHEVGRRARASGQLARSESWHRRAIMLGRQTFSWEPYARSYVSLGNLASHRGNFPQARRCQIKAYRVAKRHGMNEIMGMALHDLFAISVDTGQAASAQRYAQQAFHAYGPTHARIPYLAHDLAVLWIREGRFGQAMPVLQALLPRFSRPDELLLIQANIARAAGSLQDAQAFEAAWNAVQNLLLLPHAAGRRAQVLLNLARGATGVAQWDRATTSATDALEVASAGGESQIVFQAEAVLESALAHQMAASTSSISSEPLPDDARVVVEEFVEALSLVEAGAG